MDNSQALQQFWSSFGPKAYDESTVPDDVKFDYITYDVVLGDITSEVPMNASIWTRSNSWVSAVNYEKLISKRLGLGGVMIHTDEGAIWIKKGSPFSQRVADPDKSIRRIYINVTCEFISN